MTWPKWEQIDYDLDKDFYPEEVRYPLAKALSLLPEEVVEAVIENCIFFIIEMGGSYLSFKDKRLEGKKGIIHLDYSLFKKNSMEIAFTVAHEVAHALGDDAIEIKLNMTLEDQTKPEIKADKLAVEWLSKHYEKESLIPMCGYWKNRTLKKIMEEDRKRRSKNLKAKRDKKR